jgi:eukaryotic-like serine/threonine-protein kinase
MSTDADPPPPGTLPTPADVRASLARIFVSAPFAHSPRLKRFLTFLVEESLAGRSDRLKEYVIGLEVFSRPSTYDPRLDSLVRVEARRLRGALKRYYAAEGSNESTIIELRKGHYVPEFRAIAEAPDRVDGGEGSGGELPGEGTVAAADGTAMPAQRSRRLVPGLVALVVLAASIGAVLFALRHSRSVQATPLSARDAIVLLGFANSTGESIFDETLKQGLLTEVEQSPFLDVVSERRLAQVLHLMGQPAVDRLGREQARDLCVRAGAKALLSGSLSRLGSQYVIGLTATACGTGDDILHIQEVVARKEGVLRSLGTAANAMRRRLGESLASIRQFGTPIEEATTPSLEALQAYSLGRKAARERGSPADIVFYQRALELDSNFAAAHAALGVAYLNQGQVTAAQECLERAFRLRDRVSERERYRISASYHQVVAGELEKASEVYELWRQSYPRDFAPHANLALVHLWLGAYETALPGMREALRLEPSTVLAYSNLAALDMKLDRPSDAQAVLDEAAGRGLTSALLRLNQCYLAFLRDDAATVDRQLADAHANPSEEAALLSLASDTEAYHGRLATARLLSRRAVEASARQAGSEAAALWQLNAALREAEFGNRAAARSMIRSALASAGGRDVTILAALASARAGDALTAERLAATLQEQYPHNTVLRRYWVPTIQAAVGIGRNHPADARERLGSVSPYELGSPPPFGLATLYPVYLRGEAFLREGNGREAVAAFGTLIARRGLVLNFPLAALARLQTARGYRLLGDVQAARSAYDAFLSLWGTADPDVPVLREARAERSRLR